MQDSIFRPSEQIVLSPPKPGALVKAGGKMMRVDHRLPPGRQPPGPGRCQVAPRRNISWAQPTAGYSSNSRFDHCFVNGFILPLDGFEDHV
jgi:hypothetical protein